VQSNLTRKGWFICITTQLPQRRDRGCICFRARGISASSIRGDRRASKPGTLIIIPKGTAHGGTIVTSGPVKAIAIKIPPQPKDDVVFIN
jgi:hypothetical protein